MKQNWQFCAQPTCDDTHSVVRGREAPGLATGMITASTPAPAKSGASCTSETRHNQTRCNSRKSAARADEPLRSHTSRTAQNSVV